MDKADIIILSTIMIVPVSAVVGMFIKDQWEDHKYDKAEARRIRLKEAESLITHVKSMALVKSVAIPQAPSLESVAKPLARRRGRPSKAVTV